MKCDKLLLLVLAFLFISGTAAAQSGFKTKNYYEGTPLAEEDKLAKIFCDCMTKVAVENGLDIDRALAMTPEQREADKQWQQFDAKMSEINFDDIPCMNDLLSTLTAKIEAGEVDANKFELATEKCQLSKLK
jgi:hypothetical protein